MHWEPPSYTNCSVCSRDVYTHIKGDHSLPKWAAYWPGTWKSSAARSHCKACSSNLALFLLEDKKLLNCDLFFITNCSGKPALHQAMWALSPHAVLLSPAWSDRSDTVHLSVPPPFCWWWCLCSLCQEWLNEYSLVLTKYMLGHLGKKKKSGINAAPVHVEQFVLHYKMLL